MFESLRQSATDWYNSRKEREQLLIKIAGVVLPLVALIFIAVLFNQSLNTIRNDIDRYERSLKLLGNVAPTYQKSGDSKDSDTKFTKEVLENNEVQLTSFAASKGGKVGLKINSYDENQRRASSADEDSENPLIKRSLDIDIRDTRIDKLRKFLEEIETSDEPVVIESVTISRKRRSAGKVRATVVVTTYERQSKEGGS